MSGPCDSAPIATPNILVAGLQPGQPVVGGPGGGLVPGTFQPARVPVCLISLATVFNLTNAQTPFPGPLNQDTIPFDTVIFDTFSNAVGDGTIGISLPGYYQINAGIQIGGPFYDADPGPYNEWIMAIAINGVGVSYWSRFYSNAAGLYADSGIVTNIAALNTGDIISVYLQQQGPQSPGGTVYVAGFSPPGEISYLSTSYIGKL